MAFVLPVAASASLTRPSISANICSRRPAVSVNTRKSHSFVSSSRIRQRSFTSSQSVSTRRAFTTICQNAPEDEEYDAAAVKEEDELLMGNSSYVTSFSGDTSEDKANDSARAKAILAERKAEEDFEKAKAKSAAKAKDSDEPDYDAASKAEAEVLFNQPGYTDSFTD
mmetsp:Transcript_36703/g.59304  ORF Transcript_36703/g.59304 Transcript_36703/m.59304 type:complete len:168 (+) Transcript_36703:102-605(+)